MRTSITHLAILEEANLIPISKEDKNIIENNIKNEIDLWYEDDLKVYNEAGIYIADLKEV